MHRLVHSFAVGAAVAAGLVAAARVTMSAGPDQAWSIAVESVTSPAPGDGISPQLTTTGDRVILSWLERADTVSTLKFAERTAAGWSTPRTVVSGENVIVNPSDVPSVRVLADGTLVAQWMVENGPDPEAYNLLLAWSKDAGATWSKPVSPHHDGTKTQHGFATLFQSPGGGLGLVWLDGRATDPDSAKRTDNMGLRATSFTLAGRQLAESSIDTRVCDCCPTSVAVTSEGPLVAYRDRSARNIRDISISRLVAGKWTAPTTVHADGWEIEACPVNGPAAAARNRDVFVAWFSAKDEPRAFAAFSRDAGRTFGAPVRVDDAVSTGHVGAVLLRDGSAAVSWVEFVNQRAQLRVRRIQPDGTRSVAITVAGTGEDRIGGIPRMALGKGGLVFAWPESRGGSSRVRTARAALP